MIQFLLNNRLIQTEQSGAMTLLDFIRYDQQLRGTKIGCREGDCGACTVLTGELDGDQIRYRSVTCCLMPLANAQGRHIVTVEGLNLPDQLNRVQQAMVQNSGTQCGFCTPGFVVSLSGFALRLSTMSPNARAELKTRSPSVLKAQADKKETARPYEEAIISAIDGNICRCTGYKSIERAAFELAAELEESGAAPDLPWLESRGFIPEYFLGAADRLKGVRESIQHLANQRGKAELQAREDAARAADAASSSVASRDSTPARDFTPVGGGTDLYVQKHDQILNMDWQFLASARTVTPLRFEGSRCVISSLATAADLMEEERLLRAIPQWYAYMKLVSSTPIRHMGTVAGNLANASPIGDLTILLLVLQTRLTLRHPRRGTRIVALKDFYMGYKKMDKDEDELIESIDFELPDHQQHFSFEKVCKRSYLDIATVNSAMCIRMEQDRIADIRLSMGGVAPVPAFLAETSGFLIGQQLHEGTILKAASVLQEEISPIGDVRGSEAYKRLLARQLFFAHFIECFPDRLSAETLLKGSAS